MFQNKRQVFKRVIEEGEDDHDDSEDDNDDLLEGMPDSLDHNGSSDLQVLAPSQLLADSVNLPKTPVKDQSAAKHH